MSSRQISAFKKGKKELEQKVESLEKEKEALEMEEYTNRLKKEVAESVSRSSSVASPWPSNNPKNS
jgi:phage shock protein A